MIPPITAPLNVSWLLSCLYEPLNLYLQFNNAQYVNDNVRNNAGLITATDKKLYEKDSASDMKKTCIWESRNSSKVLLQRIFLNL